MKYNYEFRLEIDDNIEVICEIKVPSEQELNEEQIEEKKNFLAKSFSKKFGSAVELQLISKEI